jgi:3-phenylpropionate/trans-cinnamate dioxygenase ferredoxin subunit
MEISYESLTPGKPKQIDLDGKKVCVARVGDEVFAVSDLCTHADAMLSEGEITDHKIECWLHGAEFDLRTGAALTPPAVAPLETFKVTRTGDVVTISQNDQEGGK